jgi:hypothetical protein
MISNTVGSVVNNIVNSTGITTGSSAPNGA